MTPAVTLAPIEGLTAPLRLHTHAPGHDLVSRRLAEDHRWEPFETRLWLAAQRAGDVVVDAGANLGYFTLLSALCRRQPAIVYAFEPAPDNVALLERNVADHGCGDVVRVVAAALADAAGEGLLRRSEDNLGDHQIYAGDGDREAQQIELLRGDAYLASQIEHIDLLKVDTQGSEVAALRGLWSLLLHSRQRLRVLLEITPFSLRLAGSSGRELIELLAELDLPLAIVDHVEHRVVPSDAAALATWADNVESTPGDRGFMNLWVGPPPF